MGAVFFLAISHNLDTRHLHLKNRRLSMMSARFMSSLWSFAHLTYKASKGNATR
nr:MAG TPA: hypothetical protein [Caudoviricetes sp.]